MTKNFSLENQGRDADLTGHLEVLSRSSRSLAKDYEYLSGFNAGGVFETFQEEAAELIAAAEAMEGLHVTKEGIKNQIRHDLQALSERKLEEAEKMAASYSERHQSTLETLESKINSQSSMSSDEVAQISLRNSEIQGEIRGKLYNLNSGRDIEMEFKSLADQSKYDKTLARFLSKNYYLFLDRVKELSAGDMEKSRTIHSIKLAVEKLNRNGYSEKELALQAVRENLRGRSFSVIGQKRNIDQQTRVLLNKYK